MKHAMIDIETLGTTPGSVILSIGAVVFDENGLGQEFYVGIDPKSCVDAGLKIDVSTVQWWMGQSEAARAAAFSSEGAHLSQVLIGLHRWYLDQGVERVWCHGATFDAPLLEAAYRAALLTNHVPWKFWTVRCTRTLFELAGVEPDRSQGTHHNALDDARTQAIAAIKAHERLGIAL